MADANKQEQSGSGGGLPTAGQAEGPRRGGEVPGESGQGAGAGSGTSSASGTTGGGLPTAGQAEGDRATVEQDLQNRKQA
jgi:hypothetical protein